MRIRELYAYREALLAAVGVCCEVLGTLSSPSLIVVHHTKATVRLQLYPATTVYVRPASVARWRADTPFRLELRGVDPEAGVSVGWLGDVLRN